MNRLISTLAVIVGALLAITWPAHAQEATETPAPGQYTVRMTYVSRSGCPMPTRQEFTFAEYAVVTADVFGCPLNIAVVTSISSETALGFIPRANAQNWTESSANDVFKPGEVWNLQPNQLNGLEIWTEEPGAAVIVFAAPPRVLVDQIAGYPLAYSLACQLASYPEMAGWEEIAYPACRENPPLFNGSLAHDAPNSLPLMATVTAGEAISCTLKNDVLPEGDITAVEITYTDAGCPEATFTAGAGRFTEDYYILNLTGTPVLMIGDNNPVINPGEMITFRLSTGTSIMPMSRGVGGWIGFVPTRLMRPEVETDDVIRLFCTALPTPGCPD